MKRYYAQVKTSIGVIPMVVRANDENSAKDELLKDYNIDSIISISDKPPERKETPNHNSGLNSITVFTPFESKIKRSLGII